MALPPGVSSTLAPLSAFTAAPLAMFTAPLTCLLCGSICAPEPSATPPLLTVTIWALRPLAETLLDPDTKAPLAIYTVPPLLTASPRRRRARRARAALHSGVGLEHLSAIWS
jgi:hypothetical protein